MVDWGERKKQGVLRGGTWFGSLLCHPKDSIISGLCLQMKTRMTEGFSAIFKAAFSFARARKVPHFGGLPPRGIWVARAGGREGESEGGRGG